MRRTVYSLVYVVAVISGEERPKLSALVGQSESGLLLGGVAMSAAEADVLSVYVLGLLLGVREAVATYSLV